MKVIQISIIYFLLLVIIVRCIPPHGNTSFQGSFSRNKVCKCSSLTGWTNNIYHRHIVYKYERTPVWINNHFYHPIVLDYEAKHPNTSAYLRISQDTLFWLDAAWQQATLFNKEVKKEQIFAILNANATSKWELNTSTALVNFSKVRLTNVIKQKDEFIYRFEFKNTVDMGSDYICVKEMHISKERGIISITLTSSTGEASCSFYRY